MDPTKLEMFEWAAAGNDLLERARTLLKSALNEKVRCLAERIPATVLSPDTPIVLVFAGQYSAGKSTIIKALTGREDIQIGAGITTEKTHTYDWNGVQVVDTPGIHTGLRPDHDELSYRAIANADLLVFVVTNELFDSHLAQHFRTLAIEKGKAHEMLLVVNKMRRCAQGNTPEMQTVIREDLQKVLTPFSPEDLHISFIDAEAALEGKTEKDERIATALLRKSGIATFIQKLNNFVREKGLSGRYTTALYTLEQVLQEALATESTGDEDVDALEEVLLQRRHAILETQNRIFHAVEGEIQRAGWQICEEGRTIAEMIHGSADQEEVSQHFKSARDRVQQSAEELDHAVQAMIAKHTEDFNEQVGGIDNSELAKELFARLARRIKEAHITPETMSKLKKTSDISSKLGEFLLKNSFTPKTNTLSDLLKLNQYSGTPGHGTLKAIGKFFGKSFKPWEAVKWGRTAANVGRGFAVAGTILNIAIQIKEDAAAAQRERDLRESRSEVRNLFNDCAHTIEMHYDKITRAYVADTLTAEIEAVDKKLAELRDMKQSRNTLFQSLLGLLEETRVMIRNLHADKHEAT